MFFVCREIGFETSLIQSLLYFGDQIAVLKDAAQSKSFLTPDAFLAGESLEQYVQQTRVTGEPAHCLFAITFQIDELLERLCQGLTSDILIGANGFYGHVGS